MNAKNWLINTLLAITTLVITTGCAGLDTYVKTDDAALGRVVIYRNGVAYFERRARATSDRLALTVPESKVNDFLKSLTVTDAQSGLALPVSFPTRTRTSKGNVLMHIKLPDDSARNLVLSYITDAPAWKSTYRVVVGPKDAVKLQGWAIVDNTSGEDWKSVKIGVGSSSALSFRYDLRSVRRVHRRFLASRHRFAVAPPRGAAVHATRSATGRVVAELQDEDIPRPDGHPEREVADAQRHDQVASGQPKTAGDDKTIQARRHRRYQQARRRWKARQAAASGRVKRMAKQLSRSSGPIIIEGYAASGEGQPQVRALDRANTLRNALIKQGVPPARIKVAGRGVVTGRRAGARIVAKAPRRGQLTQETDEPVGESHFESKSPITVAKGTSAMVNVVNKDARGKVVYLFDPNARRGNRRFAFKAVRLQNPTNWTLDAGPMTVYGAGRFIGEGMAAPIPPRGNAIIPFAMDRQLRVQRQIVHRDDIGQLLDVKRGVIRAEVKHVRATRYTVHNRSTRPVTLYLRHKVAAGWKLTSSLPEMEKLGESRLVKVVLSSGQRKEVVLEETTPLQRTVDLRSAIGIEMMRRYVATTPPVANAPFTEALKAILMQHAQIHQHGETVSLLRQRNGEFRSRMNELHGQILSLKMVQSGGSLVRHLQRKMKEMSSAVQKTTIHIVNAEEQLMLARIRFNDGVSELVLPTRRSQTNRTSARDSSDAKGTATGA